MRYGFFNSNITGYDEEGMPEFDRAEEAAFFAKYFSQFIGNGVYANPSTSFQVLADEGMTVAVQPGACFINGYFGWIEDSTTETIVLNDAEDLARIDRIVARLNLSDRTIEIVVIKGTAAKTPVAPDIERTDDYYDLCLANIKVGANVSTISQSAITDTRADTDICGYVTGVVDQVDTSTLFAQYEAWFSEKEDEADSTFEEWSQKFSDYYDAKDDEFMEWFEHMKDQLSEDAAGKLQVEIDSLTDILDAVVDFVATEDGEYLGTEDSSYLIGNV